MTPIILTIMKTKLTLLILIFVLGSCGFKYGYLPEMDSLSDSPYGSFIRLSTNYNVTVEGELLSAIRDTLVIASIYKREFHYIDTADITDFYLHFGKPKKYPWPSVLSLSHGLWMIFTLPINAIITSSLSAQEKRELRFYDIDFDKLYLYSRYPQGLPHSFNPGSFKPAKSIE